jgi:predicted dehydrogenase
VRSAQVRADLPGAQLLASAEQLWERPDEYDVVVVATGNTAHVPQATAALRLGKTTVVDKPLALSHEEAAELVGLARELRVPLTVFQNRRWDSDTLTAQALLARGDLGPVHRLEARFTRFRPQVVRRWREDPARGGGVLLDLGAHLVDQALLLLGPAAAVYAEVRTVRGGRVDDDCFLALEHHSGARSHLWVSLAAPVPGPRLLLQGAQAGWSKQDLDGQEDALRTGVPLPTEPDGLLWGAEGPRPHPSAPGDWTAFYRAVAATARAGAPVPVDPSDSVQVLRVLGAARESALRREVVAL